MRETPGSAERTGCSTGFHLQGTKVGEAGTAKQENEVSSSKRFKRQALQDPGCPVVDDTLTQDNRQLSLDRREGLEAPRQLLINTAKAKLGNKDAPLWEGTYASPLVLPFHPCHLPNVSGRF